MQVFDELYSQLAQARVVTLQQLLEYEGKTALPVDRFESLRDEAEKVLRV